MIWSILKTLIQTCQKWTESNTKNVDIYYIGFIIIKNISDYENIHSVNPLYLIIGEADKYIEEKNGN